MPNDNSTIQEFVLNILKWSILFKDKSNFLLSKVKVQGLIGELFLLKEMILNEKLSINELLLSWRGPFNNNNDFVFEDHNIEVKTKGSKSNSVKISSENQLDNQSEKELYLVVYSIDENKKGFCLKDIVSDVLEQIILKNGNDNLFRECLAELNIISSNIDFYDHYKFKIVSEDIYDLNKEVDGVYFPALKRGNMDPFIHNIKYSIILKGLESYLTNKIIYKDGN